MSDSSGPGEPLPQVTLIVAAAHDRVIGRDGAMPWHLSADLKHFRKLTFGHTVIMGRNTFAAIGKPLPGRRNVVLTRSPERCYPGVECVDSLPAALAAAAQRNEAEVMVIGGGQVYAAALPLAQRIWFTEVDAQLQGDTRFPQLDPDEWQESSRQWHPADERNDYDIVIRCLERITAT